MKITALARGQDCKVRLPVCNRNPETVVAAHFRSITLGAGMGIKPDDIFCAHCCSSCHDACDGRTHISDYTKLDIRHAFLLGVLETQKWLIDNGHIRIGK